MDTNKIKSDMAVEFMIKYLEEKGYKLIKRVTTDKSSLDCLGCDIIAEINGERKKIEVKGSGKKKGIPDCFNTEFDKDKKFNSDLLYIIRLDYNNKPVQLQKLTKSQIDEFSEKHHEKRSIRISSTLKNELYKRNIGETIPLV